MSKTSGLEMPWIYTGLDLYIFWRRVRDKNKFLMILRWLCVLSVPLVFIVYTMDSRRVKSENIKVIGLENQGLFCLAERWLCLSCWSHMSLKGRKKFPGWCCGIDGSRCDMALPVLVRKPGLGSKHIDQLCFGLSLWPVLLSLLVPEPAWEQHTGVRKELSGSTPE